MKRNRAGEDELNPGGNNRSVSARQGRDPGGRAMVVWKGAAVGTPGLTCAPGLVPGDSQHPPTHPQPTAPSPGVTQRSTSCLDQVSQRLGHAA